MSDLQDLRPPADPAWVDISAPDDVRYWCHLWHVSPEQLEAAVRDSSVMTSDVARQLNRPYRAPQARTTRPKVVQPVASHC